MIPYGENVSSIFSEITESIKSMNNTPSNPLRVFGDQNKSWSQLFL